MIASDAAFESGMAIYRSVHSLKVYELWLDKRVPFPGPSYQIH